MPDLAYLTSFYPHAADTFIRNEITALRAAGWTVHTFSVRRPPSELAVSDDIQRERAQTVYLTQSLLRLLCAGIVTMFRSPLRMLFAARLAWCSGGKGLKARIWQLAYLLEAALLAGHLKRLGVRHLHNHIGENSATVAMLASRLSGIPFSMTVHGPGDFDRPEQIGLRLKIQRATFVVAVTEHGRSQLFRWCGHESWSKINVVRCGLDGVFLGQSVAPVSDISRFVSIGRFSEQKGHLLLLDAAARLAAEGLKFELVLIGDGPLRGALESLIARLSLQQHVRLAGWMSSPQVRQELLASRAMVLPSFAEGLPVVIMEALALGRPVISTYVAGIPELVEPGKSGWLVPAGNVDALADAMREALATPPQKLAEMGAHGRQRVLERHNIATEAAKLARLFEAAIQKHATAAPATSSDGALPAAPAVTAKP